MPDPDYNRRYPTSTFEAQYPYNQATVTRGGHEIHINDTPGNESLRLAHTQGTFAEINREGSMVVSVTKKLHYYVCDGFSETIDGQKDVKIRGNLNVNIDNDVSEKVSSNRIIGVGGNFTESIGGTSTSHVSGNRYESTDGDLTSSVEGNHAHNVSGDKVTSIAGAQVDMVKADWSATIGGGAQIIAKNKVRIQCDEFIIDASKITFNAPGGPVTITAGSLSAVFTGAASINGSGGATLSGSRVDINGAGNSGGGTNVYINGTQQVGS